MEISEAVKALFDDQSIIIRDKTIEPHHIDRLKLESGEVVCWVKDGDNIWVALDESSEEVVLFNEVEALDIDFSQESVFYAGDDYEFSSEFTVTIEVDEGDEEETATIKDFERSDGQMFRVMEYQVSGEILTFIGWKVAEEEIQST